jgi:hypothetical protein
MATLSTALDTQTNLITVSEALSLDSLPEPIVIDSEVMLVTGGSGLVYSVTRGANGTARASHAIGSAIGGNPLGSGTRTVTRTVTRGEILGLFDSPVSLVPAVAGVWYWPLQAFIRHTGADYTWAGGWFVGPVAGASGALLGAGSMTSAADGAIVLNDPAFATFSAGSSLDDLPLLFGADTGNPTVGTGTLQVTVVYYAISTTTSAPV